MKILTHPIILGVALTFTLGSFLTSSTLLAQKYGGKRDREELPQSPDTGTPSGDSTPGGTRSPNGVVDEYSFEEVSNLEGQWEDIYEKYFNTDLPSLSMTPGQISQELSKLSQKTGKNPAVIWMNPTPNYLALYVIIPGQPPFKTRVPQANREALSQTIKQFQQQVNSPESSAYRETAQQLYKWLIQPVEYHLLSQNIDTLILCVGPKLRSFPFAALYDGEKFLVEKYALTRIPGFNLTNWDYVSLKDAQVLAMGASEFTTDSPLPGVATELPTITPQLWPGISLLNQEFTLANLKNQRQTNPYSIIHLATHAQFNPGNPSNSYIQFSDTRLSLDQMKQLNWNNPTVNLLVLSACNTALGNIQAELGFVGLAIQSGVISALGSLWRASDIGTLGMMSEFYWQLKKTPLKAEALRQAQIAMLKGQIRWQKGRLITPRKEIALTADMQKVEDMNLSHPYYWSGFSLVGNPF